MSDSLRHLSDLPSLNQKSVAQILQFSFQGDTQISCAVIGSDLDATKHRGSTQKGVVMGELLKGRYKEGVI